MTTLLAFAFVLGVLVFVHELGHFLMARWHGVRVLTFSLGFGPMLLKVKRGDTEYALSAIPLGGYVKMAGENPEDQPTGGADEFLSKTKWQRFQILFMGPLMNLLLAVVLTAVVLLQGADIPAYEDEPVVVGKVEAGSPAEQAGIRAGDRIVRVAGEEVPTWERLPLVIGTRADRDVPITIVRGDAEQTLSVRPKARGRFSVGEIGVLPDAYPLVQSVIAGGRAEAAGVKDGDMILAINGERMVFRSDVVQRISKSPEKPLEMLVRRDGTDTTLSVTPALEGSDGRIGVTLTEKTRTFQPTALEAVGLSVQRNIEFSGMILRTLWGVMTGQISLQQLMGPVGIAQLSGESAQAGWVALLALMASISLNLGLLNLLPVPILDGGHILIMGLEAIARRDFSMRVKEKMLLAGFVFLMALMVTVIYNDLMRISWIERMIPWRN